MTYSAKNNPVAAALGIDPAADWIGIRQRGKLIAVVRHMPSRNGYSPAETLYAQAGRGFTPNNPGFAVHRHIEADEIRRRFALRFVRAAQRGTAPTDWTVEAEMQDPELMHRVIASRLEAEFRAQEASPTSI